MFQTLLQTEIFLRVDNFCLEYHEGSQECRFPKLIGKIQFSLSVFLELTGKY